MTAFGGSSTEAACEISEQGCWWVGWCKAGGGRVVSGGKVEVAIMSGKRGRLQLQTDSFQFQFQFQFLSFFLTVFFLSFFLSV